jgi:hypothetical protein
MPVNSQSITVGNCIVGAVSIDGGAVRGDGGPIRPQLVFPLKLQLNPAARERAACFCYVSALLSTDQNASPHAAVCQPVSATLMDNFNARSIPHGPVDHTVQLHRAERYVGAKWFDRGAIQAQDRRHDEPYIAHVD